MWVRLGRLLRGFILLVVGATSLAYSAPRATDEQDRVRAYTRDIEFDYLAWMLGAAGAKIQQAAVGIPGYLDRESSRVLISDYLQVTERVMRAEDAFTRVYSDPSVTDKTTASQHIRGELDQLSALQRSVGPLAEGVLQEQISQVAADFGLTALGEPVPPVLYHSTSVPDALIVSPRARIEQTANISIIAGLAIDKQAALEARVESGLDVSALVVPIGGVGVYPTMVMRSTDLNWLVSTIGHEWTHNYLEFRPLGLLYDHTPELRTMNETTADIVGGELGAEVIGRYYPELQATAPPQLGLTTFVQVGMPYPANTNPPFNFRAEMHTTRVTVDALLAAGQTTQAESYMEQRRQVFVANNYFIRRLNQAYFAFYGAYADVAGGAAGEDPVGPAVRALRAQSHSLAEFVNRIAWMTSFEQLKRAVGQ